MTLLSDNRGTSSTFGAYIEEVQEVLRANQINFGTPSNFPDFVRTFDNDPRLREDLVSLTRSIMERDKTVSLRKILTIIAVASGGPDLAISDRDMSQPVDLLTDLITRHEGYSPASVENRDHTKLIDDRTRESFHPITPSSDRETQLTPPSGAEDATTPDTIPASSAGNSSSRSSAEDHYAESLTRLELNSLQMKHYLDSIDQRISRMEPRLDSLPEYLSTQAPPKSGHPADARYSAPIATEIPAWQPQNSALPPTPPGKPKKTATNLRIDSRQALAAKRSATPVNAGLATLAVVLVSLIYWSLQRDTTSTTIRPVTADLTNTGATTPANLTPSADFPSTPPNQHPPSKPTPVRLSKSSPRSSVVAHPSTAPATESTPINPSTSAPEATPETDSDSSPSTIRRINVSSGVMAANVLSAPQPSYPKLASLTHMQGEVVMKAVVSKEGTIEDIHVIKGHRLLRSAATNAVRTWRYRPFLVDGRPVEVATIVTVDFKLPR